MRQRLKIELLTGLLHILALDCLSHGEVADTFPAMTEQKEHERTARLALARRAFKEFYAKCFWSYRDDLEITEEFIPFVIRGLREHGGMAGYRIAAQLCQ